MKLAEQTGLSPGFIAEIEAGKKFPSSLTLARLSEALRFHPSELFLEEEGANTHWAIAEQILQRVERELRAGIARIIGSGVPARAVTAGRQNPREMSSGAAGWMYGHRLACMHVYPPLAYCRLYAGTPDAVEHAAGRALLDVEGVQHVLSTVMTENELHVSFHGTPVCTDLPSSVRRALNPLKGTAHDTGEGTFFRFPPYVNVWQIDEELRELLRRRSRPLAFSGGEAT